MIIALASPRIATDLDDGLDRIDRLLSAAASQGAKIACLPEAYLPGLRGQDFEVFPFDLTQQERALRAVAGMARTHAVATILGMERITDAGRQIAAFVIDARGELVGFQTKNQLDPTEDEFYVPGDTRRIFEIDGLKFGVAICHEGWRYPETVRWAAARGAQIVFHPQHTGSDRAGVRPTEWGARDGAYYEKAMLMRSIENTEDPTPTIANASPARVASLNLDVCCIAALQELSGQSALRTRQDCEAWWKLEGEKPMARGHVRLVDL